MRLVSVQETMRVGEPEDPGINPVPMLGGGIPTQGEDVHRSRGFKEERGWKPKPATALSRDTGRYVFPEDAFHAPR